MIYVKELELRYRRRAVDLSSPLSVKVTDNLCVYRLFSYLQEVPQEKFLTLHLDTKNKIQSFQEVSAGTLNQSLVDPAEVFRGALLAGVKRIVGVHNHPSGDPTPSREDIELTKRLEDAGEIIGVQLLDHIIIGEGYYTSYKEGWRRSKGA